MKAVSLPRAVAWVGLVAIASIVLITYLPAFRLNFYGDDYSFIEKAGRSRLGDYLAFYLDPRLQTGWYRPVQGMLFGIEWLVFGGNSTGYHVVNVVVHLFNCVLLGSIVWLISSFRTAFLAAIIYAVLPLYAVAVFWPADADFLVIFFYLLTILFWILFLQGRRGFQIPAYVSFLLALATKEFGVTLPGALLLIERFIVLDSSKWRTVLGRYLPFLVAFAVYLPIELSIQSQSVLTNQYGYGAGPHVVQNFVGYLAAIAYPWLAPEPFNLVWLAIAIAFLLAVVVLKRSLAPLALLALSILAFLPVVAFPWFFHRYLYGAVMVSAIFIAHIFSQASHLASARWAAPSLSLLFALVVASNGMGITNAASDFAEISRQTRVPFRDITQHHATFPNDTFLYFVDQPSPIAEYSGMFYLRYGPSVSVSSNERLGRIADLRMHQNSYVIYFDEEKRTREIPVEKTVNVRVQPDLPIAIGDSLRFVKFEIANAQAKRGDAFALLAYFEPKGAGESDLLGSISLVNDAGKTISTKTEPLRPGDPNALFVLPLVISVPQDSAAAGNYRLELSVLNSDRQPIGGNIIFGLVSITE